MSQHSKSDRPSATRHNSQPERSSTEFDPTHRNSPSNNIKIPQQQLLNQKLIPRDYLNLRSRTNSDSSKSVTVSPVANQGLGRNSPTTSVGQEAQTRANGSRDDKSLPLKKDSFERTIATSGTGQTRHDEVISTRTISPESVDFHSSMARQVGDDTPDPVLSSSEKRPVRAVMPRTTSIDSAISNISTTSIPKATNDHRDLSPGSIRTLIAGSGGAENLVAHLLKDKSHVASQNAQLWKLVEKQRALLLGLNKDLERIKQDRDKYKKRAKELQEQVTGSLEQFNHELPQNIAAGNSAQAKRLMDNDNDSVSSSSTIRQHQTKRVDVERAAMESILMPQPLQPRQEHGAFSSQGKASDETDKENRPSHQTSGSFDTAGSHLRKDSLPLLKVQNVDTISLSRDNGPPVLTVIETTPSSDKPAKGLQSRKAPPRPLDLSSPKDDPNASQQASAASELTFIEEAEERGRRRTREEDDQSRAASAAQAEEARSRSMKDKQIKVTQSEGPSVPMALPTPGLPMSPRPQHAAQALLSPHGVGQPGNGQPPSLVGRMLASALKSPGLPMSPRPMHRFENQSMASLPQSPRANLNTFPLSPRAPKQPLPVPTNPAAPIDPSLLQPHTSKMSEPAQQRIQQDRLQVHEPPTTEPPSIYRGLAVPAYPNLLLPPNALPSIQVKVASSRLRPSRHSVIGIRPQDDAIVFSLSVISRSSYSELWRIEKVPASLPQLEAQLKSHAIDLPKIPDRKLFTGHSPMLVDARRQAIDEYFEELLDTQIDDAAAVMICQFLSTDVIDPEHGLPSNTAVDAESLSQVSNDSRVTKTGYLTKKGKNFGGWKSRYFTLENGELKYFESPTGAHLGTIKVQGAQIGKQKPDDAAVEEQEGQYRHAFLIQEPKRRDTTNYVRHVLCAESDAERDDWVHKLLKHTDGDAPTDAQVRPKGSVDLSSQFVPPQRSASKHSKEESTSKDIHSNSPTPSSTSSIIDPSGNHATNISGPLNGGVITDSSSWGNKAVPMTPRDPRDKGYKMSNIFNFKKNDQTNLPEPPKSAKPRILRHNGYVRAVFGLPLAEAVQFCAPFSGDIALPAVVYRCIEYLRFRKAANEEGLFRLSGSNLTIRILKDRFNEEGDVDLTAEDEYHDIHAVASLFKTYFRELPSTLLTRELHIDFVKTLEIVDVAEKVRAFNVLIHRLPAVNLSVLQALTEYLLEVTQLADRNKMTVRNMGIVFSPTLNIPTPVFTLLLEHFEEIFQRPADESSPIRTTNISAPQTLSTNDIRSPRQQLFSSVSTPAPHQMNFPGLPSHPQSSVQQGASLGELGFIPATSSYESGRYVSIPEDNSTSISKTVTQAPMTEASFTSLNGMLAPENAPSAKAKRRESAMIFPN